jgi:DNA-directed RNA polymerase specialized sigma24 family protein
MATSKSTKVYKKPKSTSTKGHYVTNAQLIEAIAEAKKEGKLTDKLARYLHMIAERYSYSSSFGGYSFREDMVSFALVNLCSNWHKFNPEKSDNPFAFYTTAVYRSFLQYLSEEKKQRDIRDELLIDAGANPSFSFQERAAGKTSDETAFRQSTPESEG